MKKWIAFTSSTLVSCTPRRHDGKSASESSRAARSPHGSSLCVGVARNRDSCVCRPRLHLPLRSRRSLLGSVAADSLPRRLGKRHPHRGEALRTAQRASHLLSAARHDRPCAGIGLEHTRRDVRELGDHARGCRNPLVGAPQDVRPLGDDPVAVRADVVALLQPASAGELVVGLADHHLHCSCRHLRWTRSARFSRAQTDSIHTRAWVRSCQWLLVRRRNGRLARRNCAPWLEAVHRPQAGRASFSRDAARHLAGLPARRRPSCTRSASLLPAAPRACSS